MTEGDVTSTQRIGGTFYGWYIVAAAFVTMMVNAGLAFYAQSVYLAALVDEQGFSVRSVGIAIGFFFMVSGVAGWLVAGPLTRHDPRWTIAIGALLSAASLVALGEVREVWQMFAVYFFFGIGFAAGGLVPATTLVTRWFNKRRSVALSVASTGLSVGGIVITPLVSKLIEDHGLSEMAWWFGLALLLGVLPVSTLVHRSSPAVFGLFPDGADEPPEGGAASGMLFSEARKTRFYIWCTLAFVCLMAAQVGAIQHQFNMISEREGADLARLSVTLLAGTSVVGRLCGGYAATRMPIKTLTTVLIVIQAIGIVLLGVANSPFAIVVAVMIFGAAVGNVLMLQPLVLAEAFGVRDYSRVYGFSQLASTVGVGAGPALVGIIRDAADYQVGYLLSAVVSCVGIVFFVNAGPVEQDAKAPIIADPLTA